MFESKKSSRKWLIQMIHIAKSNLQMADESYRALLAHHGKGKTSSINLSVTELQTVLDAMVKLGFKAELKPAKNGVKKRLSPATKTAVKDERAVMRAIWIFMAKAGFIDDGSEVALNAWVKRMTAQQNGGEGIAEVQWLQGADASKMLESLKRWCRRCMYEALQRQGVEVYQQASYQVLLDKWHRVHGQTQEQQP
ncbi:gp16 family protein [Rheinheimera sp. 4Y26]|uniref:gp16 family protein n=1 Tax=Rheinheimera sp. 4Y26 TaxID=2977811 RepID=UPI0021B0B0EB|nr:regulatory protein GemA [Rheinheimera sp. 4Y26]MCT6700899.1 regulatory protein GemA [Rheinheimera sp. 4Y26]